MSHVTPSSMRARLAAWSVHVYTATGLVLGMLAIDALMREDLRWMLIWMMAATFVDAPDGTLARRANVRSITPQFDGRKLDDIVDYLNFAFIPCLALFQLDILPEDYRWTAMLPLLASGYGFCQDRAKTDDAFVGFPSYWNVLLAYWIMIPTPPGLALAILVTLSALVWVPIHYVYPTKTVFLRRVTLVTGYMWAASMVYFSLRLGEPWVPTAALISLAYPVYYLVISLIHHRQVLVRSQAPV